MIVYIVKKDVWMEDEQYKANLNFSTLEYLPFTWKYIQILF